MARPCWSCTTVTSISRLTFVRKRLLRSCGLLFPARTIIGTSGISGGRVDWPFWVGLVLMTRKICLLGFFSGMVLRYCSLLYHYLNRGRKTDTVLFAGTIKASERVWPSRFCWRGVELRGTDRPYISSLALYLMDHVVIAMARRPSKIQFISLMSSWHKTEQSYLRYGNRGVSTSYRSPASVCRNKRNTTDTIERERENFSLTQCRRYFLILFCFLFFSFFLFLCSVSCILDASWPSSLLKRRPLAV